MMTSNKKGRGSGAGWSPYAAAKRCEVPYPRFHRAMEKGEVKFVEFGDVVRITDQEIARVRGIHGLSPTPENPDEPPLGASSEKAAA